MSDTATPTVVGSITVSKQVLNDKLQTLYSLLADSTKDGSRDNIRGQVSVVNALLKGTFGKAKDEPPKVVSVHGDDASAYGGV